MDDHRPDRAEGLDIADELGEDEQTLADDQAAADWDRDHGGNQAAHTRTAADRAETSRIRDDASDLRDLTGRERDRAAEARDELSAQHDELARGRDRDAAAQDLQEDLFDRHTLRVDDLRARSKASRLRAATARVRAASDREQAAEDRRSAALDREQAAHDREDAGTDELTGARRRGVGLKQLEDEIERARRDHVDLVAAYVDVNGLKSVNDKQGHAAGDELLRTVAAELRGRMRSYDLVVRLGGDEFLCTVPSVGLEEARRRFADLSSKDGPVSVGFSELEEGDTAAELIARADHDLLARRNGGR